MNRVVSLGCLAVLASAFVLAPRPAHAGSKPTVAVLGLELKDDGTGIDEQSATIARLLTDALRKRARAPTGPFDLVVGGDKELVDAVLLAGCDSPDKDCMVQIGADMKTDFLIYGRMEKTKDKGYQVSLTLLDISKKERVRQLTETILKNETGPVELERAGKTMYGKLAGESTKGTLMVTANVPTGSVYVDDQPKGNLVKNQARIQGLEAGRHRIRVESDGWVAVDTVVTINGGETTEQPVTLKKVPETTGGTGGTTVGGPGNGGTGGIGKNLSREGTISEGRSGGIWRKVFWGSTVVAVGAGAVWGYSFAEYSLADSPYGHERCNEADLRDSSLPVGSARFDKSCKALDRTWIVGPITAGAVAIAGVAFYLGYVRPPSYERRASRRAKRDALTISPVITPDTAGATLSIEW